MPKIIAKYSVTANNKPLSLIERITPSKAIRAKYTNLGKPRKVYNPPHIPHRYTPMTLEERIQNKEDYVQHIAERTLLSRLVSERNRLDRPDQSPITVDPEDVVTFTPEVKPLDPDVHFKKSKIMKRVDETRPLFEATKKRFQPLLDLLDEDDDRRDEGEEQLCPNEVRSKLWDVYEDFQKCFNQFDTQDRQRWEHKKWRCVIGAMKRFSRFKMESLKENYVEICTKLVELNLTFDE